MRSLLLCLAASVVFSAPSASEERGQAIPLSALAEENPGYNETVESKMFKDLVLEELYHSADFRWPEKGDEPLYRLYLSTSSLDESELFFFSWTLTVTDHGPPILIGSDSRHVDYSSASLKAIEQAARSSAELIEIEIGLEEADGPTSVRFRHSARGNN